jgi:hypothetical protein
MCAIAGKAETEVSGIITDDQRWSAEKSPYIVTNDILVTKNARLIIAPGATILVKRPQFYDTAITQFDHQDSLNVAIHVEGMLSCIGRRNNHIVFSSYWNESHECSWYGIILDSAFSKLTEIAFTDIAGACNGITVQSCAPLIRNTTLEFNNVGIRCLNGGDIRLYNSILSANYVTAIQVERSNPIMLNTIIAFNKNNGIMCDGLSAITLEYSCLYGNYDGNFIDCPTEFGILSSVNKNDDSTDAFHNIYMDPIFAGSKSDSLATVHDISLPTEKQYIRDTSVAKVMYDSLADSLAAKKRRLKYPRFSLSQYSPCIDAGSREKRFRDADGSRNDMGIWGGQEFFESRE